MGADIVKNEMDKANSSSRYLGNKTQNGPRGIRNVDPWPEVREGGGPVGGLKKNLYF